MNIRQHKFVTELLRSGDKALAYKNAYNAATANYDALESSVNRLLRDPEVAQTLAEAQARIREQVEQEVAKQQKGQLLTMQKKRELLYQIATGEMHVLQYHKGKDCNTCTQYVTPTINQMLRAIHLDSKLAGHYPQQYKQHSSDFLQRSKSCADNSSFEEPVPPIRREGARQPLGGGCSLAPENTRPADLQQTMKNHNNSQQVLSPAGGGVRLSADGGGALAQENQTTKKHNKTQQNTSPLHSAHNILLEEGRGISTPKKKHHKHTTPALAHVVDIGC